MTSLALLLVLPLVWPFVAKMIWKHEITLGELGLNLLVGAIIVTAGWYLGRYVQAMDVEIFNGQVLGKESKRVSCEHSYTCNCRESCSGSGSNRSCSTTCSTCYEHSNDWDWVLKTNVEDVKIRRIDRQGKHEPPRYTQAQPGDPVSLTSAYQNYIRAAPDSLFHAADNAQLLKDFESRLPAYPADVYDYHYVDRVLNDGAAVPDLASWNRALAQELKTLGPLHQVNVVLVFTSSPDPRFADALNISWLGGKKNDVIVVLGTPQFPEIAWSRVLSWTDREVFKVQLRDALLDLKTVEQPRVLQTVREHIQSGFKRRPMSDFEYLKNQIEPPAWVLALLLLVSMLASVGAAIYFAKNGHSSGTSFNRFRRFR